MADWKDVMAARSDADQRAQSNEILAGQIEDGERTAVDPALATLLAGNAIALELRALGTILDYSVDELRRAMPR